MTNRMGEIAKMFGVEIGEIFKIKDSRVHTTYYRFTEYGLECSGDRVSWIGNDKFPLTSLTAIMTGAVDIIKLPWIPDEDDYCYIADITRPEKYFPSRWEDGVTVNEYRLEHGFVFRTKNEAIECANKILASIKSVDR